MKKIQRTARAILNALDCHETELSILIVDDQQIAQINLEYRGKRGPTNVIAFAMREGPFVNISPHLLGDVVISVETAFREAQAAGIDKQKRFNHLLIHGILHLMGYDHEKSAQEANDMEQKTHALLAMLA